MRYARYAAVFAAGAVLGAAVIAGPADAVDAGPGPSVVVLQPLPKWPNPWVSDGLCKRPSTLSRVAALRSAGLVARTITSASVVRAIPDCDPGLLTPLPGVVKEGT